MRTAKSRERNHIRICHIRRRCSFLPGSWHRYFSGRNDFLISASRTSIGHMYAKPFLSHHARKWPQIRLSSFEMIQAPESPPTVRFGNALDLALPSRGTILLTSKLSENMPRSRESPPPIYSYRAHCRGNPTRFKAARSRYAMDY